MYPLRSNRGLTSSPYAHRTIQLLPDRGTWIVVSSSALHRQRILSYVHVRATRRLLRITRALQTRRYALVRIRSVNDSSHRRGTPDDCIAIACLDFA